MFSTKIRSILNTFNARKVISSRFPIGVETIYSEDLTLFKFSTLIVPF